MSNTPVEIKIAGPYSRALFEFASETSMLHGITADLNNFYNLLEQTPDLLNYLKNPLITAEAKIQILDQVFKGRINQETIRFFNILIKRNRINLLIPIIHSYLELVYKTASIKEYEIYTAFPMTKFQKWKLINKLKSLTDVREISLNIIVDENLIGGFLIKTSSKIIDFTIKNRLEKLAKHLDAVLDI